MKLVFLCPYPPNQAPSQRFRFEQYIDGIQKQKNRVLVYPFFTEKGWRILYKRGKFVSKVLYLLLGCLRRLGHVASLLNADRVFIHREAAPLGPPIFEWFIRFVFRKKIIYDFDDAIWIPNTSPQNRVASFLKCHWKVKWICRWSYKISCGNEYLMRYAAQYNPNAVLIPTTVDTARLHNPDLFPKKKNNVCVVGWTGTHSTLRYLDMLVPVFRKLGQEHSFTLLVIANQAPDLDLPFLQFLPWRIESEIEDLLRIDIGIMPLEDDPWAEGKCGFKALQYMALGIPVIASAVGLNKKIIRHGENGFLCTTIEEWKEAIKKLLLDPVLGEAVGKRARADVEAHYSVTSNTPAFFSLFE